MKIPYQLKVITRLYVTVSKVVLLNLVQAGGMSHQVRPYNGHAYWTYGVNGSAIDWGRFKPSLVYNGRYQVYRWVPTYAGVPTTQSAYVEIHSTQATTQYFTDNQRNSPGQWVVIGSPVRCLAGTGCNVTITDRVNESSYAYRVWFDAIKFEASLAAPIINSGLSIDGSSTVVAGSSVRVRFKVINNGGLDWVRSDVRARATGPTTVYFPNQSMTLQYNQSSWYDQTVIFNIPGEYTICDGYGSFISLGGNCAVLSVTLPAPVNLLASGDSPNQINLSWTDKSNNETGFKIERSPNGSSNWTQIGTVGANVTTFQNSGLACNTTYYYRVRAYNTEGDSGYSNTASATTSICAPNSPTLNTIINTDGDGNYTVSWNSVSNATSYTLQEATNNNFTNATTAYAGSSLSTAISNKSPGTYYYRVLASNTGGNSGWSNIQTVVVVASPSAPTLNTITNADGDGNYTVSWNSVSNATSYTLQEATNNNFTNATTAYSGSSISTLISTKLPGTYYYRVRASNAGGNSGWSNIQTVVVVAPPSAPTLNTIANADGDGTYAVSWNSVSNATSYALQEASNSTFTNASMVYTGSNTSATLNEKAPGTYYYRVRASNVGGNSGWSNVKSVIVAQPILGDVYEPDDTCTQASLISTDGLSQIHTFHQEGDEDWVVFQAAANTTYRIEAQVPPGSSANASLEVYGQCAGAVLAEQDHTFSPGVVQEFTATVSGSIYLRWINHDPAIYGDTLAYHLSVRALEPQATSGAIIIVAGRLKAYDDVQPNIHYISNEVYQLFQGNGYSADRIAYLATDLSLPGVDAPATAANLQEAITTWALDKVDADHSLTLYLVDHGTTDMLYLDEPSGQWVTSTQLDSWLTQLETARPGLNVNVIIEACKSGSFIKLEQTISKKGRVIITSTGSTNDAYAPRPGAVFSDRFIAALKQGQSLHQSFLTAKWATEIAYSAQTPWLDDGGNGIPNETTDWARSGTARFWLKRHPGRRDLATLHRTGSGPRGDRPGQWYFTGAGIR